MVTQTAPKFRAYRVDLTGRPYIWCATEAGALMSAIAANNTGDIVRERRRGDTRGLYTIVPQVSAVPSPFDLIAYTIRKPQNGSPRKDVVAPIYIFPAYQAKELSLSDLHVLSRSDAAVSHPAVTGRGSTYS